MLVPDDFEKIMGRAGRPVRVPPQPTPYVDRAGVLLAALRDRVAALGETCAGVRGDELADLLDVAYALGERIAWPASALDALRKSRRQARGGYDRVLVWDPQSEGEVEGL